MNKQTSRKGTPTLWADSFAKTIDVTLAVGRAIRSRLQFVCIPGSDIMHGCITSDAEIAELSVGSS